MSNKNNIVSIILFSLSVVLFVIFTFSVFFGGQKLGGAIYFIYFVTILAFNFLDRKYASNFIHLYRYSAYVSDAFNILALGSIIYYGIHRPEMIAAISLIGVAMLIDLFSKNRIEKRRLGSIIVGIFNCALMFCVFPFFFMLTVSKDVAICIVILSSLIVLVKLILAIESIRKKEKVVEAVETIEKNDLIDEVQGKNDSEVE